MYEAANATKSMKDMAEPVFMQPVRPTRKYYNFWTEQQISNQDPMVETRDQFTDGQMNTKLFDDAEWQLDLDLFMVVQKNYEKDQDAWIKNRA